MFLNKTLNTVLTETEISTAHVCHFLLGNTDKISSHQFTVLNFHNVFGWLLTESKKYDHDLDVIDNDGNENNDNDDNSAYDDVNATNDTYSIRQGNTGLVLQQRQC